MDFTSAFNTIIPDLLLQKLTELSVPTSICQWITSFLTDRQQLVKLGKFSSSTHTISTGAPQGCVLSPLLFSLYTNDCTFKDPSVKLLKFADNATVIGLIQDGDESAYRQEVKELAVWCSRDDSKLQEEPPCTLPSHHHGQHCNDSGDIQIPRQHHLSGPEELLKQFYTAIIESVLCTSITVWFSSATKSDLRRLHRTVRTAERIIGTTVPTLQELYLSRVSKKAGKITLDPSHPAHSLYELLPSGRTGRNYHKLAPEQGLEKEQQSGRPLLGSLDGQHKRVATQEKGVQEIQRAEWEGTKPAGHCFFTELRKSSSERARALQELRTCPGSSLEWGQRRAQLLPLREE
ncbi:putative RNA-directed DNA polymerase from transposon BS [Labeo rohita]|uniref:RNA-directed DNA polymerase from transposon BS n=1 Tax=Labeo rohita TaxID=84645 RepID=A0ABQ8M344_LABRO|nr:putative RNA-directed DNA polymerase from transposon BS [Labeo rohita]